MNLRKLILTQNDCFRAGRTINIKGIMVHSTGANNPALRRYVGPDDGLLGRNAHGNHWNQPRPDGRQVCVHAFIGRLQDGTVATYQTLPWNHRAWHSGSGPRGTANDTHISFEICEDGLNDRTYFNTVYQESLELCAYLCATYNLEPLADGVIMAHYEGHARGVSSNHKDPRHWFTRFGKTMDIFRAEVNALMMTLPVNSLIKTNLTPVTVAPSIDNTNRRASEKVIWDYFKNKGFNDFGVAGLMGNLFAESGLRPNNLQDTFERSLGYTDTSYTRAVDNNEYGNFIRDSAGYGLAQWTFWTRKRNLLDFAKQARKSIGDLSMQLDFLYQELINEYKNVADALRNARTVLEASNIVLFQYERPADQSLRTQSKRAKYGQQYYDRYKGQSSLPPLQSPVPPVTTETTDFEVKVDVGALNIRGGPGTEHAIRGVIRDRGVYTIIEENNGWGRLKSGLGWISLQHTRKI